MVGPSRPASNVGRGATHPYSSPSGQRSHRRQATSAHGCTSERASLEVSTHQPVNSTTAPAARFTPLTPTSHVPLHQPMAFDSMIMSAGSQIDPTNPDMWNPSKMSYSAAGQAAGRSHRSSAIVGSRFSSPVSRSSTNLLSPSPLLPDSFLDSYPTYAPSMPQESGAPPQNSGVPDITDRVHSSSHRASSVSVISRSAPVGTAGLPQVPAIGSVYLADHMMSPLPLLAPLFLSAEELNAKLTNGDRYHFTWENWEHQLLIDELLGPNTPLSLICNLFALRGKDLEDLQCWVQVEHTGFNKTRTPTAILNQWLVLRDGFQELVSFLERAGIDLNLPVFQDPRAVVSAVIMGWRTIVEPSTNRDSIIKLKLGAVAAWTHDPINGWLATFHKR
ncbi:hypothetical protein FRC09_010965 [Ceratobasidium sp. 395]|nr:hypothetical protein FRC09_010965 [Ceratobasidium sp. 395]